MKRRYQKVLKQAPAAIKKCSKSTQKYSKRKDCVLRWCLFSFGSVTRGVFQLFAGFFNFDAIYCVKVPDGEGAAGSSWGEGAAGTSWEEKAMGYLREKKDGAKTAGKALVG